MCTESLFSDGMFDKIAQAESLVRSLHTSWESSPMSVPEEKSTPAKTHDELKLPDCLDTSLFRTHLINADKEWSAVKCDTCAVSAYDYTVGGCHMLYCPACRHYSCEDCCVEDYDRKSKNSTYYCSHCNKPIFDITGPRTYECLGEWPVLWVAYLKIVWHWLSVWWSQFHFRIPEWSRWNHLPRILCHICTRYSIYCSCIAHYFTNERTRLESVNPVISYVYLLIISWWTIRFTWLYI